MEAYVTNSKGEDRAELVEAANAAGRPMTLGDHDVRSDDIAAWLAGRQITPTEN